jgi:hypothetical protein
MVTKGISGGKGWKYQASVYELLTLVDISGHALELVGLVGLVELERNVNPRA